MAALVVPYLAAALLLAAAGVLKLRRPAAAAQALRTQRMPSSPGLVRVLGLGELVVAVAALAQAPYAPVLVAAAYAGFTAFVLVPLVTRRPLSSCGCFAEPDTPPTAAHPLVTGGAAAVAVAVAGGGPAGLPALLGSGPVPAALAAASAALVTWLGYLVLTELPRLRAAALPLSTAGARREFTLTPVRSASS